MTDLTKAYAFGAAQSTLSSAASRLIDNNLMVSLAPKPPAEVVRPLTCSLIIAIAMARAEYIEGRLTKTLDQMKASQGESDVINDASASVAHYASGITDDVGWNDVRGKLVAARDALPQGSAERAKLDEILGPNGMMPENKDPRTTTESDMRSITTTLDGISKSIDRNTQEKNLVMTDLIHKSDEVWTQASNLLQVMHETSKACIGR